MKLQAALHDQRGVVLVIALVMLLVLTLIGINAVNTTTYETNIAGNERLYNLAFYAADGGIEDFRATAPMNTNFLYNPSGSGHYYNEPKSIGKSTYDITFNSTAITQTGGIHYRVFEVTSEGVTPNFPVAGRVSVESVVEITIPAPGY